MVAYSIDASDGKLWEVTAMFLLACPFGLCELYLALLGEDEALHE